MKWQPIETAPKDGRGILLYGQTDNQEDLMHPGPLVLSGYWDTIDEVWCATTTIWCGPFVTATHWMPLPEPPKD